MADFFHGVKLVEISDGISQVQVSSSSVIGVIGTAPDAKDEDFPLNTPVLITGSRVEAAKLGEKGTLPAALDGILSQCGALVVVVRVAEEKNEITDEESGETLSEFDEEKTIANFVGAVDSDGTYTGVNAFLATRSKLGVTLRILLAPEFSTTEVVQEMIKVAERLRAVIVADCPVASGEEVIKFVTDCASERVYAVYPQAINTKKQTVALSPYAAGVIARTDNETGFWCSPSNKSINGIIGLSKDIDFSLGDPACRANYLNEKNIATVINQNGYKLWGNRSTANEGSYKFLCVRRTADIIADLILRAHLWAVDRNIVKNYLTDVSESVNAFLANLKAQGAILDGKCFANKELNTAANIAEGKVYFDFQFTPAYPAEQVTFRAYLNADDVESILLENLGQ